MTKTKKTILSAILCFAMVLCLSVGAVFAMPITASAATEGTTAEESGSLTAILERIDALPSVDDFSSMTKGELQAVLDEVFAIFDLTDALKQEEQDQIDFTKLTAMYEVYDYIDSAPVENPIAPAAKIGDGSYQSLDAAITAVKNGETIKLIENIQSESIVISRTVSFDIDSDTHTNGATITAGTGYKLTTSTKGRVTTYKVVAVIGDSNITWELTNGNTVLTIGGEGEMPDFTVVDRVCDAPWSGAKDTITSIEIGSGVKRIGSNAFYALKNVTSVDIPEGVEVIGAYAFASCVGLTSVTIPSSLKSIEDYAFTFCNKVSELHISDIESWFNISVEDGTDLPFGSSMATGKKLYIGKSGTPTTEIVIPKGITSIPDFAFFRIDGITKVTIPSSVTSIGDSAFYQCKGLTEITIPSSVTSIGDEAFSQCTGLTEITIPSSVASIGNQAFYGCTELTSVTMEAGVKSIGNNAFSGCTKLTEITLPNTVTSIGGSAFQRCSELTSVTIPNSVTSIGSNAFDGCRNLNELHIGDIGSWCKISFANTDSNPFCEKATGRKVYVGKSDTPTTEIVIPEGVETINQYAFYNFDSITSVTIPSSVTSIGSDAFSGCTNINELHIGDIGSWCNIPFDSSGAHPFYAGAKDKKVYIGKSDTPTTEIVIPEGVETVNDYAFYNFDNITSVTIPSSVTSIGINAFYKCAELKEMTIPDSVTSIGNQAFQNCSGLTSVTIPSSVTSIGNSAFYRCAKLTEITIPDSVTSIGSSVFSGCAELTSVTIPSSVTSIGSQAFYQCAKLKEITIPDSVTSIGGNAFNGCTGLSVLVMKSEIPATIATSSFKNAPLTTIYVPNGKTEAYSSAENWSALTGATFKDAYMVNAGDMENGKVSYDKDYFPTESFGSADKTVTITVTPDNGYHLKSLAVLSAIGMARPIIPEQDTEDKTKYTFTMPGYSVIVKAEFEEITLYLPELDAKVKALEDLLGVDGSALNDLINQAIAEEVVAGGSVDQAIKRITDELGTAIDNLTLNLAELDSKVDGCKVELSEEDTRLAELIKSNDDAIKAALDQAKKELGDAINKVAEDLSTAELGGGGSAAEDIEKLTGEIQELSGEVDVKNAELAGKIAENKAAIEKLIFDLNALDKKLEGYQGQLDKAIADLEGKDGKLEELIVVNDKKASLALDQAKSELNKLIEDTAKELKTADAKNLEDLTKMINDLSDELKAKDTELESKIGENKAAIEKVAGDLENLDKKVEGYKTALDIEDGRLAGLIDANDKAMKGALDTAKGELNKLIEDTAKELKAADAKNLEDLTKMINALSDELKAKDTELAGEIADNKAAIEKVAGDLENLDEKVEGYKTALDKKDRRLASLIDANDDAIKAALEQAKTDINGLIASKVEELQGADTKNLADLTAKIEELSAQVEEKNSELAGKIAANTQAIEKVAKDLADLDAKLESKDKQIEDNISTFVTVAAIVGSLFLICIVVLFVLVLKKKREEK